MALLNNVEIRLETGQKKTMNVKKRSLLRAANREKTEMPQNSTLPKGVCCRESKN